MYQRYRPANFDISQFYGQFILTAENKNAPEGWTVCEYNQWKLYVLRLQILNVYNQEMSWLGWCIGHPVINGQLYAKQVVLQTSEIHVDMDTVDDFYQCVSGKWALFLMQPGQEQLFLDPYGSLPAVYSIIENTVASTPSLLGIGHEWNEELIQAVGLPENDKWLPSGLTSKTNVFRLLPNHCLHIQEHRSSRHWPTPETDLSINNDIQPAVEKITTNLKNTIAAVAKHHPLCFSLTAGMDSRMILACARDFVDASTFITFIGGTKSYDVDIPALLARRFKLNHQFIQTEEASSEELEYWLALTGLSASGTIWKIHKSLKKLDPHRVLLPGTAGEIGRWTIQWRNTDRVSTRISASDVLTRCKLPQHPALLKATEEWVAGLQFVDTFTFLALIFTEQRLGCWAAPQHYGNTTSAFEFSPFNSREIFHTAMRFPHEYRWQERFVTDIIRYTWPELLELPFNQFTGIKGFFDANVNRTKKFLKGMLRS